MADKKTAVIETIQGYVPSTKAVKRALIAGIPWVGGSLDHLIFDKSEELFLTNLERAVNEMSQRLSTIEEQKIDKGWFESKEALSLFKTLLEKVEYEQDTNKIRTLSQIYTLFGTSKHVADPNKFAVLETLAKLTSNQLLVFRAVNKVPVAEKTATGGAIGYTGKARWQSSILEYMNSNTEIVEQIQGTILLDVELDILVSFNLLANVILPNSDDHGFRVTQLGKLAYSYLKGHE